MTTLYWSGRWFRMGTVFHAERFTERATLCGRIIRRDAKPVDLSAMTGNDDICDGCWNGANR